MARHSAQGALDGLEAPAYAEPSVPKVSRFEVCVAIAGVLGLALIVVAFVFAQPLVALAGVILVVFCVLVALISRFTVIEDPFGGTGGTPPGPLGP